MVPASRGPKDAWAAVDQGDLHLATTNIWKTASLINEAPPLRRVVPMAQLAEGAFGDILLCSVQNKGLVAVKMLAKEENTGTVTRTHKRSRTIEEKVLRAVSSHPFVVDLYFTLQTGRRHFLGLEYCRAGDLFDVCTRKQVGERTLCVLGAELWLAMSALHSKNIAHLDVKLENVGISSDGHVRLFDFGACYIFEDETDTMITETGTLHCASPEILQRIPARFEPDYWAFGISLYELFTGTHPFDDPDESEFVRNICTKQFTIPKDTKMSPELQDLFRGLFRNCKTSRYGYDEIRTHEFFTNVIEWEAVLNKQFSPALMLDLDEAVLVDGGAELQANEPLNRPNCGSFVNRTLQSDEVYDISLLLEDGETVL